jgi:GNAT superfamily N-acetyltransferase
MKIRRAKKTDYDQLMNLYNGFVGEDRYSKYIGDSFYKVLQEQNSYIYVACENGKLIGFTTFSVRTVVRYPKPIAELDELYVNPDFRGKGLGVKLLQTFIEKAKELNCYRLYIESHYDHKPAHGLYSKMGFTNYGFHFIKNL